MSITFAWISLIEYHWEEEYLQVLSLKYWVPYLFCDYISYHGTITCYPWSPWVKFFMPVIPYEPYKSNNLEMRSIFECSSWVVHAHNSAWTLQVENHESSINMRSWTLNPTSIQEKLRVKSRSYESSLKARIQV